MRALFIVLTVLFLSGCLSNPVKVVTVTEYKAVTIPDSLLQKCDVSTPPNSAKYVASNAVGKESLLTDYSINLLNDLQVCNKKFENIRLYQDKQKKILEEKPAK